MQLERESNQEEALSECTGCGLLQTAKLNKAKKRGACDWDLRSPDKTGKPRMHVHVFRQAQPFPIPNSSPWKYSIPSVVSLFAVMQHKRSVLTTGCAAHTGVPKWNWNVPNVQLDAAELCRSREQHPREPSMNQPHSNDLALLGTGNYRSADMDELPETRQPLDRGAGGLEAALHTEGKGLC